MPYILRITYNPIRLFTRLERVKAAISPVTLHCRINMNNRITVSGVVIAFILMEAFVSPWLFKKLTTDSEPNPMKRKGISRNAKNIGA